MSASVKVCFTKTTICQREWNRMLYRDRRHLTGECEVLLDLCSPLRPPGDPVAARVLVGGQAGGDKWVCCTWGRHCGSLAILGDTWGRQIDERCMTSFCQFKGRQSYMQRSGQKLSGSKQETDDWIASLRVVKQDWAERHTGCLYSSQVLVILVEKCMSEKDKRISLKAMSSMSYLRWRAKLGLSCIKQAQYQTRKDICCQEFAHHFQQGSLKNAAQHRFVNLTAAQTASAVLRQITIHREVEFMSHSFKLVSQHGSANTMAAPKVLSHTAAMESCVICVERMSQQN